MASKRHGVAESAEVDFENGVVTNLKSGNSLPARTIPPQLLKIVEAGGIFPLLEKEGYIAPTVSVLACSVQCTSSRLPSRGLRYTPASKKPLDRAD
jgi:hypothetical protein